MEKHEQKSVYPTHPKSISLEEKNAKGEDEISNPREGFFCKEAVDGQSRIFSHISRSNFIELHRLDAPFMELIFANLYHFCIFTSKNSPSPQSIDDCNIVIID